MSDEKVLTREIAEQFIADEDSVDLCVFAHIEDAAAESLSKHRADLALNGLASLSDAAAECLSYHDGSLALSGVTSLSDAAAESLSKHKGEIFLEWDNLSESAAAILRTPTDEIDEPSMADEDSADRPGDSSPDESALPSESELKEDMLEDFSEPEHRWPKKLKEGYRPLQGSEWVCTEKIGTGGFGQVWKATQPDMPDCVFKFTREREQAGLKSLKLEINRANQLAVRHPGFVPMEPFLRAQIPCVRMEFIEANLLDAFEQRFDGAGPLPPSTAANVILQVAEIMAVAHQAEPRPVVHRDLKPQNIMVQANNPTDPSGSRFRVIDFGIAAYQRSEDDSNTDPDNRLSYMFRGANTPNYAAPEQIMGHDPHPRQDVYALGMIWYELLTAPPLLPSRTNIESQHYDKLTEEGMTESQVNLLKACTHWTLEARIQNAEKLVARILDVYPELKENPTAPLTISTENELTVEWSDLVPDVTPNDLADGVTPNEMSREEATRLLTLADGNDEELQDLLEDVTSLSVEAAEELVRFPGKVLHLDGLEELSVPVAEVLVKFQGDNDGTKEHNGNLKWLTFEGLNKLSLPVAKVLARFQGDGAGLTLAGLEELPAGLAEVLAGYEGYWLDLSGVEELSIASAEALGHCKCKSLFFDGLTEPSPEAMKKLMRFSGVTMSFEVFKELSVEIAQILARFKVQSLLLNGLKELSPAAVKGLAKFSGSVIELTGLQDMPEETAKALAKFKVDELMLTGLEDLSTTAAQALVKFKGDKLVLGIRQLTSQSLRILMTFSSSGELVLDNVGPINDAVASEYERYASEGGEVIQSGDYLEAISDRARDNLELNGVRFVEDDDEFEDLIR